MSFIQSFSCNFLSLGSRKVDNDDDASSDAGMSDGEDDDFDLDFDACDDDPFSQSDNMIVADGDGDGEASGVGGRGMTAKGCPAISSTGGSRRAGSFIARHLYR